MKTVPVTIKITSTNNGVKATVDPFVVVIDLGDEVQWKLESDYDEASVTIEKKNSSAHWPFVNAPPKDIKKGNSKKSGKTKPAAKKQNRYNIQCRVMDGTTPIDFPIDPDIIIIGGAIDS
ncbi:MAG: hypothetical protein ABIW94_03455 [Gemmatimonadaceae bacterium]